MGLLNKFIELFIMPAIPNPDQRWIRYDGCEYSSNTRNLCAHCGIFSNCPIKPSSKMGTVVHKCTRFVPILGFREPLSGMSAVFNTMRLGAAWVDRIKPGSIVALMNVSNMTVFGYAEVLEVDYGPKDALIKTYASKSHTVVDKGMTRLAAQVHLERLLPKMYGKMIYNSYEKLTVITLSRLWQ